MKILITAGPTQEPIDAIRYITNRSSGKMGIALAEAALEDKHKVTLVCSPISIDVPAGVGVRRVRTSDEMIDGVLDELEGGYDIFISAAAIADFTPERPRGFKIKSDKPLTIKLKPTRKLTRLVKKKFSGTFVVGFKAEYDMSEEGLIETAYSKLMSDKIDLIVANDVYKNRFGSDTNEVYIIDRSKNIRHIAKSGKKEIAKEVIQMLR